MQNADQNQLHKAVRQRDKNTVKTLLDRGANPNAMNDRGETPLHIAIEAEQKDVIKMLLEFGADVNTKMEIKFKNHSDSDGLVHIIRDELAGGLLQWSPLHLATCYGQDIVALLIVKGADVNIQDRIGRTPLHWIAQEGQTEIAELLLAKGADPNKRDSAGQTPLHLAAIEGHQTVALSLIKSGANINVLDGEGFTPLFLAKARGNKEMQALLRRNFAKE
jgi:ankyrin repeat protein